VKAAALVAILATATLTLTAQDNDRARAEALAQRAAERLQALHQEADRLTSQERTLLGDLRKLEVQRQIKSEELQELDRQAAAASAELSAVNSEVARLEREEEGARPQLQARLVELYKLGEARYVRMMLSLTDVRHAIRATRMVAVVARRDHDQIVAHERRLVELAASRRDLEDRGRKLTTLSAEAARAREALGRAVDERNRLVADIDARRDLNAQLAGELQAAQQGLQTRLRDEAGGGPVSAEPLALPLRPFQGELDWPVAGSIRQRFGRQTGGAQANGIEIQAPEGSAVKAVHDGTVAFADIFSGFGRLVIVDHGGQSFSVYGNLSEISVAKGDRIEGGRTVGNVGASVMGVPGLHFELRIDGRPVDPLQWLRKR
jgi:septal ring factor EnvC (AmiA/AmiB activator)